MSLSPVAVKTAAGGIRRSAAMVLMGLAVMGLAGCDIDWLDVFDPDDDDAATSDTTAPVADTDIPGLNLAVSDTDFTTTANALANGVDSRTPFRSQSVDFQDRADDAGPDIRPTRAIFYYNASLMAPLIAADPRAGLDLPPAVLVYQTDDDSTAGDAGTDTGIGTGNGAGTGSGIGTGTTTGTENTTGSGAAAGAGTNNGTGASAGFGSGTGATAGAGSGTGASSGFGSGTGASTGFGSGTGASTGFGNNIGSGANLGAGDTTASGDGQADVGIAYNAADYLAARYDLDENSDTLDAYEDDLSRLATDAAGNGVSVTGAIDGIAEGEGITRQTSDRSFSDTIDNLQQAIDARDNVSLLGQFDHAAAAQAAGTMLTANNDPAILYVIDATDVISALIAGGQTVAVDLPIRILVSRDADGRVSVYHDTPAYLVARHDLENVDDAVDNLNALLDDLVEQATGG